MLLVLLLVGTTCCVISKFICDDIFKHFEQPITIDESNYVKKNIVSHDLNIINQNKINLLNWQKKIKVINDDIIEYNKCKEVLNNKINFVHHQDNFEFTLAKIQDKEHYCYWYYQNNLEDFKKSKMIIFDFNSLNLNATDSSFNIPKIINYLSFYAFRNQIIFTIIGNEHPNIFLNFNIKYINKNNYLSPYNYKKGSFDSIRRLPKDKFSKNPPNITIDRMIKDLLNQYGFSQDNILIVTKQPIQNFKCVVIT
tara:strand:+ start:6629 stop:7387 length:759 start_codon:yes stop_codon:yes gene_type:complete